ncbi:MAG: DUF6526 family protein [Pyrinomonadaceae bacterium]
MAEAQNYSNHVRWFPLFHFFLIPVLTLHFLFQAFRFYQEPGLDRGVWVFICFIFIVIALTARLQALKVQDRVIRLEDRLRYKMLLPPELASGAIDNIRLGQMIALRFASDEELPGLVERTLKDEFETPKDIKLAVKNWRGDHHRV